MRNSGVRNLVACLLLVLLQHPGARAQNSKVDLSGWWSDGRNIVEIKQAGTDLRIVGASGEEFIGTLTGNRFEVRHRLDQRTVRKSLPQWVQEELIGKDVSIQGTLLGDNRTITATFVNLEIKWEQKGEARRITERKAIKIPLRLTAVTAKWDEPADSLGSHFRLEGFSQPVAGVHYLPEHTVVTLLIESPTDLSKSIEDIEIRNLFGSLQEGRHLKPPYSKIAFNPERNRMEITFDGEEVLRQIPAGVNLNVLLATATIRTDPSENAAELVTKNVLHIFRQKLVVFLPGVLGSVLWVKRNGEDVEAYPRFSKGLVPEEIPALGEQYLKLLDLGPDGKPTDASRVTKIDLFRSFGVGSGAEVGIVPIVSDLFSRLVPDSLVYDVERLDAVKEPPNHPRLFSNDVRVPYYLLQPWPYDWRLDLQTTLEILLGPNEGGKVDPPYSSPPSLKRIVNSKKEKNIYLDDKVAVVGHSTGGVILRGAVARGEAKDLVEKAFFIDVPLFGAPKAYFVYLTGAMGIPFLGDAQMQLLSPNMPIVYHLAPTRNYPDPVATADGRTWYRRYTDARDIMRLMVDEARTKKLYPGPGLHAREWNRNLELDAEAYHLRSQGPPAMGWKNCVVFSSTKPAAEGKTIGRIFITNYGVDFDSVVGDGTVPLTSQLGDFAQHDETRRVPIPNSPLHAAAPNQEYVWEEIIKELTIYP